jgi:hypothetical protein
LDPLEGVEVLRGEGEVGGRVGPGDEDFGVEVVCGVGRGFGVLLVVGAGGEAGDGGGVEGEGVGVEELHGGGC